jgi:hypothetical protein
MGWHKVKLKKEEVEEEHFCALPWYMYGRIEKLHDFTLGDVIQCDECGKYWKLYHIEWGGRWSTLMDGKLAWEETEITEDMIE